jgi:hypothetical protein
VLKETQNIVSTTTFITTLQDQLVDFCIGKIGSSKLFGRARQLGLPALFLEQVKLLPQPDKSRASRRSAAATMSSTFS